MDTQLSLSDAEDQLSSFTPAGMTFMEAMNKVTGRLTLSGKWKGTFMFLVIPSASGYITLPPRYLSVLAGKFDHWPVGTFSQWWSYMEAGPGDISDTMNWIGRIVDQQDGVVTQTALDSPGGVRIYCTGADVGKVVRIYGTQEETAQPVVDPSGVEGENLTLALPFVQSTLHYSDLTGVQKPLTNGPLQAKITPTGGGTEYQVAEWQSWESRPSYRRYFIGPASKTVRVLCQRRPIKMISGTDWVIPGNLAALQCGLQALSYEQTGYNDSAMEQWEQAYYWLNQEAKSARGGGQIPIPLQAWGVGGSIPFSN